MFNEFKKCECCDSLLCSCVEYDIDLSMSAMWAEFLQAKSNNAKIKNKYFNSLHSLKVFVERVWKFLTFLSYKEFVKALKIGATINL